MSNIKIDFKYIFDYLSINYDDLNRYIYIHFHLNNSKYCVYFSEKDLISVIQGPFNNYEDTRYYKFLDILKHL
jgi:hypothetical protein